MLQHPAWAPRLAVEISEMIQRVPTLSASPIAALDFDETCILGDISHALLSDHAARFGPELEHAYEAACLVDKHDAYARLVELLLGGRTPHELRTWTRRVLDQGLSAGTLRWRGQMEELVFELQSAGWEVWVVTASPEAVVQVPAQRLGIPADRVIGMRVELGEDGRYLPKILEPITYRAGKPEALLARAGGHATFAAGDSETDTELLASAQYGLLIDRGDEVMRTFARARSAWVAEGWQQ